MGCHALLQGIFRPQGSNPGLPHCTQILYHLSHPGSPGCLQTGSRVPLFLSFHLGSAVRLWSRKVTPVCVQLTLVLFQQHQIASVLLGIQGTSPAVSPLNKPSIRHRQTPSGGTQPCRTLSPTST